MSVPIDLSLAKNLIHSQFPQWSELPITQVKPGGWDNRTFRLGNTRLIRLPSAERYAAQVKKEQKWLPQLASHLPLPIPKPVAMGTPGYGYPWFWSVYEWQPGKTASQEMGFSISLEQFAMDLAHFLKALYQVDLKEGPLPGEQNFFRGGNLGVYDGETRQALKTLGGKVHSKELLEIWEKALTSTWEEKPVWLHGDISPANLLVQNGKLSAVIDFGGVAVGDPACDLAIAWTFFSQKSRQKFYQQFLFDSTTWERARGWALWKTLITLVSFQNQIEQNQEQIKRTQQLLKEIQNDKITTSS